LAVNGQPKKSTTTVDNDLVMETTTWCEQSCDATFDTLKIHTCNNEQVEEKE
jgi:hypothetical protein